MPQPPKSRLRSFSTAAMGLALLTTALVGIVPGAEANVGSVTVTTPGTASVFASFTVTVALTVTGQTPLNGATVLLSKASGPGAMGGTLTGTTNASGVATFANINFSALGSYTIRANVTATDGKTGTGTSAPAMTITAGAPSRLAYSAQPPASVTSGAPFGATLVVQDAFGNTNTSSTASITLASSPPGLAGTLTTSASAGIAAFSGLTLATVGSYTLNASASGLANATSSPVSVTPGAASKLAFTTQPPASVAPGFAFEPVVAVQDASGNTVTSSAASVAISSIPTGVGGTLARNATAGLATFTGLTLTTVGTYTLTATSSGLAGATSTSIAVAAGALDHISWNVTAPTLSADAAPATLVASARDAYDNARNDAITYASSDPNVGTIGPSSGTFTPDHVGSTTITATSGAKTAMTTVNVTVGALHHVAFTAAPTTTDADTPRLFQASAYDAHDNPRSDPITYTRTGTGTIGSSSGLFTPDLVGNATITATAGARNASATITTTVGALHHVTFTTAPATTDSDTPVAFSASPYDAHGNLRADAIAYSLFSGSGAVGPSNGTFTPDQVGTTTIRASAGAVHADASITVTVGALHHVSFTLAPATTDADTLAHFHAEARDAHDNPRASDPISYSVFSGSGSIGNASGDYTPNATGAVVIRATSGAFHADAPLTVTPGALDYVAFTLAPATTDADTTATFHAVAYDAHGNARSADIIAYAVTSGGGAIDGATGLYTPDAAGNATIRATAGARNASATILVTPGALALILVTPPNATLEGNDAIDLAAAAFDAHGNAIPGTLFSWSADCGSVSSSGHYTAPAAVGACVATATSGATSGASDITVIDDIAPTVSASASCSAPGLAGWCRGSVLVTSSASDAQTSLAAGSPSCTLDGAPATCGNASVDTPGNHTFVISATDAAGNHASANATFRIDADAPTLALGATCALPGNGAWCRSASYGYAGDASDATSGLAGVASCTLDGDDAPCSGTVTTPGPHTLTLHATDAAGNANTTSLTLGIDATAPTLDVASACAIPGTTGWCRASSYAYDTTSSDAGSGLAGTPTCTLDGVAAPCAGNVTGEGPHELVASVEDVAGNPRNVTLRLAIDSVAPVPVILIDCATPGNAGWCRSASYKDSANATDATSGVATLTCEQDDAPASCDDPLVTGEGAHHYTAHAVDVAGNEADARVDLAIDSEAPHVTLAPACATPGNDGWCLDASYAYAGNATDATSGLAGNATCTVDATGAPCSGTITGEGAHGATLHAADLAGNEASASFDLAIDSEAPDVTLDLDCATPGTTGWCLDPTYGYRANATDATSGLVPTSPACQRDATPVDCASGNVTGEGAHTVSLFAADAAGHSSYASASLAIDSEAPSVSVELACATPGTPGWCRAPSFAYFANASDLTSGLSSVTCTVNDSDEDCDGIAAGEGPHTIRIHATDAAGRAADANATLSIDSVAPALAPHADETAEATSASGASVTYAAPLATDATSGAAGAVTCAPAGGTTFDLGDTLVTCSVTDAAGNPSASNFTVHVVDTTAPTIDAHANESAEATGAGGAAVSYAAPATHDAVDGDGSATCAPASGALYALGNTTVTCSATDAHANAATNVTFTVTVRDTTAPLISPHADETHEATGATGATVAYDAPGTSDAVDGPGVATCAPASGALFALGDTTVTCDATDAHGNAAATTSFTLHVVDTTPPTIDAHGDEDAEATSAAGANVSFAIPLSHDAVDGDVPTTCAPANGSTFALGHTTVTCSIKDSSGNDASRFFDVLVHDQTAPLIAAHDDETHEATNASGASVAYAAPATSDAVDGPGVATCAPPSGATFPLGNTTVACDATDANGNAATTRTFTIRVVDTTAPTIDAHDDETAEATNASGATVTYASPATHDAVDGDGTATCAPASGSLFALGNTTVTCSATDDAGNAATDTTFVVHVQDTTPAVIDAHDDASAEATSAAGAAVTYDAPLARDAVDADEAALCAPASGATFPLGTTTVTCTHADAHGNPSTPTSFEVLVYDATAPTIDAHDDETAEATNASGATVTYSAPSTHDAVDGDGTATCAPASGTLFPLGDTTVTCDATDAHANAAASTTFEVHVVDTTAPTIDPHDDQTVEATNASGATVTYSAPATHDAVDGDGAATCAPATGSLFPLGDTTVTCDATDGAGNAATSTTFDVHVVDTTPPTIGAHDDEWREAANASGAVVTFASPTTSDTVDANGTATCAPASGSLFALGETTVTCSWSDAAGNEATDVTFVVHVVDTTAPAIDAHDDETAEATNASGATVTYASPATHDAVDGDGTATCSPASGSLFALGATNVTCDASDTHANAAASATFVVRVRDTTAPTIDAHANVEAEASGLDGAHVSYAAPATHDAVDGDGAADCSPLSGGLYDLGATTVTCTATDAHGNDALATSFVVYVNDTIAPTIDAHGNETAEATNASGATVAYAAPATHDAVDGDGTATCAPASGSLFPIGDTTVTCDASDGAGNAATPRAFTVRVTDTTAPTLDAHANETAEATSASGATVVYAAPATHDAVDGDGTAACTPDSGATFALGTTSVHCSVTDAHGNAAASSFDVTVRDTTPPSLAPHADEHAEATGPDGAPVTYDAPASTDAVDGFDAATCLPASGATFPLGDTTVDCDDADAAGNPATTTRFTVHIRDATPPAIDPHDDEAHEATSGAGAPVAYAPPATHDAVDGDGVAECAPASGATFALGSTEVTCTATDAAGNAATPTSFRVTVRDTTAPTIDAHGDETAEATSAAGAIVAYDAPPTSDAVDGASNATCLPTSGTTFTLGNTTVTCSASDAHGNAATPTSFTVRVQDTTPPTIDAHAEESFEATSAGGALVTYAAPATHDAVDGDGVATCTPASGTLFPNTETEVTCDATDAHGNHASSTFDVYVGDTTPPTLTLPASPLVAEATSAAGAAVAFAASATDVVDGTDPVTCAPASGATFALGDTTVTCSATDTSDNTANGSFTVRVRDTTAPTLTLPGTITRNATSASGATVTFAASATDAVDGTDAVSCAPASGSLFPIGNTTVACSTHDAAWNWANGTFRVDVRLRAPPTLALPANIRATATTSAGALVTYAASAYDLVDGPLPATCAPASGSRFALGITNVTCRATNSFGLVTNGTFTVNVTLSWSGFITPIPDGGSRNVNADLPVKFSLTGASGPIRNLTAKLYTSRSLAGPWSPATPQGSANVGNSFRYDTAGNQYIYNLAGRSLGTGAWYLRIDLGDGTTNTMQMLLR